ncbi:hypothetical protein Acr_00g0091070 [Actinidia rufa]|uniref:Retrotransposon Copia-like N-terminal domain-containing protein n=1 Tax=Actinidia rufa TaxID=165716 RepID=A0A7J0DXQ7_9ERIC|nr:hypothetical protein Acr_00g0091070 [Actinidia rufa]
MSGSDVDNVENVIVPPPPPRPDFSLSQHTPDARITCELLNGKNFAAWSRSVRLFLGGKGKSGWLLGTITKPNATDPKFVQWEIDNCTILGWLFNSMEPRIYHVFMYHDMVPLLWSSLTKIPWAQQLVSKAKASSWSASAAGGGSAVAGILCWVFSAPCCSLQPLAAGCCCPLLLLATPYCPLAALVCPGLSIAALTAPDLHQLQTQFQNQMEQLQLQFQTQLGSLMQQSPRPNPSPSTATLASGIPTALHVRSSSNPSWVLDSGADDHMTGPEFEEDFWQRV